MRALIARYWKRLIVTEEDTDRGIRSFWLQFAAGRFPDIKSAAELVRVAELFTDWHRDGAVERVDVAKPDFQIVLDGDYEPGKAYPPR